jgi:hypothetical protein
MSEMGRSARGQLVGFVRTSRRGDPNTQPPTAIAIIPMTHNEGSDTDAAPIVIEPSFVVNGMELPLSSDSEVFGKAPKVIVATLPGGTSASTVYETRPRA